MPSDKDFVRCEYTSANRGDHSVVGPAGFAARIQGVNMIPKRGGDGQVRWHINYGYFGGGQRLLAHKRDIALWPHLFRSIEAVAERVVLPAQKVQATVPPPPRRVEGAQPMAPPAPAARPPVLAAAEPTGLAGEMEAMLSKTTETPPSEPELVDLEGAIAQLDRGGGVGTPIPQPEPVTRPPVPSDLQLIPGITPEVATNLRARGVTTGQALVDFVRSNSKTALMAVRGIGKARAEAIIEYVNGIGIGIGID